MRILLYSFVAVCLLSQRNHSRTMIHDRRSYYISHNRIDNDKCLFINSGNIYMVNNQPVPLNISLIRNYGRRIKEILKIPHVRLEMKFVNTPEMRTLYKKHFGKDKSGDIISLRIVPKGKFLCSNILFRSKIYICPEYIAEHGHVKREGIPAGVAKAVRDTEDISKKIGYLLIHGLLHILGYNHEKDEDFEKMLKMEEEVLSKLNVNFN